MTTNEICAQKTAAEIATLKDLAAKVDGVFEGMDISYVNQVVVTRRDKEKATIGYDPYFNVWMFHHSRLDDSFMCETENGILDRIEGWKNERIRTDA